MSSSGRASAEVAEIGGWPLEWFREDLDRARVAIPHEDLEGVMRRFAENEEAIAAHSPWAALALSYYQRSTMQGRDSRDLQPAQVVNLLRSIAAQAEGLQRDLTRLDAAEGASLSNDNEPKWRALLTAQRTIIRAIGGPAGSGEFAFSEADAGSRSRALQWQASLRSLSRAAESAAAGLSAQDVSGGFGPRLHGLGSFISLLARVWRGFTGRTPTAERRTDGSNPDFMEFVIALAEVGRLPAPTRSMVRNVLSPTPPRPRKLRTQRG